MSQSHIILVRHGEASEGWPVHPDPGLSELGRRQAAKTGDSLIEQILPISLFPVPRKEPWKQWK